MGPTKTQWFWDVFSYVLWCQIEYLIIFCYLLLSTTMQASIDKVLQNLTPADFTFLQEYSFQNCIYYVAYESNANMLNCPIVFPLINT